MRIYVCVTCSIGLQMAFHSLDLWGAVLDKIASNKFNAQACIVDHCMQNNLKAHDILKSHDNTNYVKLLYEWRLDCYMTGRRFSACCKGC